MYIYQSRHAYLQYRQINVQTVFRQIWIYFCVYVCINEYSFGLASHNAKQTGCLSLLISGILLSTINSCPRYYRNKEGGVKGIIRYRYHSFTTFYEQINGNICVLCHYTQPTYFQVYLFHDMIQGTQDGKWKWQDKAGINWNGREGI